MLPSDRRQQRDVIRAQCAQQGVERTRERLVLGHYQGTKRAFAEEWLRETDARAGALSAADEREIDRGISRRANSISFWVGITANCIAVVALAVAIWAAFN